MGFEALLCDKNVYTYGVPFYAGWGITNDRGNKTLLNRRSGKKRSIEELFWFAYIWYSRYFHPIKCESCELEELLEYLVIARDNYFKEGNKES
jgi:capsular polysaccharide export protein